jgi:hypothetical protein
VAIRLSPMMVVARSRLQFYWLAAIGCGRASRLGWAVPEKTHRQASGEASPRLFMSSLRSSWTCDLLEYPYCGELRRGKVGCELGVIGKLNAPEGNRKEIEGNRKGTVTQISHRLKVTSKRAGGCVPLFFYGIARARCDLAPPRGNNHRHD